MTAYCGWQKIRHDRKSSHPSRGGSVADCDPTKKQPLFCIWLGQGYASPPSVGEGLLTEPQLAFMEHDHAIQAFPPDGSNEALDVGVLPRSSRGDY